MVDVKHTVILIFWPLQYSYSPAITKSYKEVLDLNKNPLFTPIKIGSMELKNRLIVPAMGTLQCSEDGSVTDQLIEYWAARAKGGWSLLLVEVTAVDPLGVSAPFVPVLYDDRYIPGMKKLADEVHKYGAKIGVQLYHAGRQAVCKALLGKQPVAPSPIPCPLINEVPHELTTEEVYELIEKFGDAALRARQAGMDCVELHSGHGYLIAEFMSAYSNKRTDEFGGTFKNRMRFPVEIVSNIRRKAGHDFPINFRYSCEEKVTGGREIEESRVVARIMEEAGVDCFNISVGVYSSVPYIVQPNSLATGYLLQYTEQIKKSTSLPVIAVGRIKEPHMAEEILSQGRCDIIGMGRQALSDPDMPKKLAAGKIDEIAPNVACLQGCQGGIGDPVDPHIRCLVNPFCGYESTMKLLPAEKKKKVVVVGGGPAGLEAWIAASRGHQVVLMEKESQPGGQYRIAAFPPAKQEIAEAIAYYQHIGKKYGVEFRYQFEADKENILKENPDAVVVATGGEPLLTDGIKGIENVVKATDILIGKKQVVGKVLIIGSGMVGLETADFLSEYVQEITVVEMLDEVATDMGAAVKYFLLNRLKKFGVEMLTGSKVTEVLEDGAIVQKANQLVELTGFDVSFLYMIETCKTQVFNALLFYESALK